MQQQQQQQQQKPLALPQLNKEGRREGEEGLEEKEEEEEEEEEEAKEGKMKTLKELVRFAHTERSTVRREGESEEVVDKPPKSLIFSFYPSLPP